MIELAIIGCARSGYRPLDPQGPSPGAVGLPATFLNFGENRSRDLRLSARTAH